ncbi:MAG: hypothetical protein NC121_16195 [Blautia sp.]|nr:hypothetical protein [Blautia sp.]
MGLCDASRNSHHKDCGYGNDYDQGQEELGEEPPGDHQADPRRNEQERHDPQQEVTDRIDAFRLQDTGEQ